MEPRSSSLVFRVHRQEPELISPAKPTPRELKILSDLDDQDGLRHHLRSIFFYRHNPSLMVKRNNDNNNDPVKVIRKALAETLVYYYPFAGRLWEGPNRKLMVDCTGEGVVFVEADADVALDEFGDELHPPFPCFEELLFDVEGSSGVLNSPLLLIQVTRLKCGGFILAVSFNHVMCDGIGISLFLKTVGELACGANTPSVPPVWDRHLLNARVPPRVTHAHYEYDEIVADIGDTIPHDRMVQRSFFFGPKEISVVRRLVPADLRDRSTTFELLTSLLWRCRTIAMRPLSNREMRVTLAVNARPFLSLPPGYYGNSSMLVVAITTAKELSDKPLGYALRLVHDTKSSMTEEYVRSTVDLLATRGRPHFTVVGTYLVSDVRHLGPEHIDFGWGRPVFASPAEGRMEDFNGISFLLPYKNKKGEIGTLVPIILPAPMMNRFAEELARVFDNECVSCQGSNNPKSIRSSL